MKKTFAALTLATIMMFGSTLSFADGGGIIISDAANPKTTCTDNSKDDPGIIIFGLNDGIIIFGVTIIAGSGSDTCKEGIIITD